ncbi:divergent polysaccharide deacetylase family protein [Alteromonas gilva]|uniref:Divergent polysaccharide deacetylase family protein n=1 Tax=Alteromonas gilva TaxID=2987522 RepID=A0ABT5L513_9ALTE|nr:divergent polysaccharide deacetylase family protein [Alteromonas gilva]MDC8832143.1 divergent polysaccharide deacetylase family protein [Alteromonas gilva]
MKQLSTGLLLWLVLFIACLPQGVKGAAGEATPANPPAEIYIIIDDMGYRPTDVAAFALPAAVTFAILPHTPQGSIFAEQAHAQARDVMLHLPMQARSDKLLGPGAITADMFAEDIARTIDDALAAVPYAIGVNNHMGSQLTASGRAMQNVMHSLKQTGLFFVDSRTTANTVAQQVARQYRVPNARRHVFLDHEHNSAFMNAQWQRMLRIAQRHGKVIAIAHPHPSSIAFLKSKLASLPADIATLRPMRDYFRQAVSYEAEYAGSATAVTSASAPQ